jgi:trans-aconitate 2-methyltransferase
MTIDWDPRQYLQFSDERSRPFHDLIARIPLQSPRTVVDLGCGPGSMTAALGQRWPTARVTGVDSSPEMIEHASRLASPPLLSFELRDLRQWSSDEPIDVLVSSAALQWVADHTTLFGRFMSCLARGGVFAFQVPGNFDAPSHRLLRELATSPRWERRLAALVREVPVREPAEYVELLSGLGASVDAWETTYLHMLTGSDAVLEWTRGTALRPFIGALDAAEADELLASYAEALGRAYPADDAGRTIYPFRRIFVVARAAGGD